MFKFAKSLLQQVSNAFQSFAPLGFVETKVKTPVSVPDRNPDTAFAPKKKYQQNVVHIVGDFNKTTITIGKREFKLDDLRNTRGYDGKPNYRAAQNGISECFRICVADTTYLFWNNPDQAQLKAQEGRKNHFNVGKLPSMEFARAPEHTFVPTAAPPTKFVDPTFVPRASGSARRPAAVATVDNGSGWALGLN
jgi:hypothetical protein